MLLKTAYRIALALSLILVITYLKFYNGITPFDFVVVIESQTDTVPVQGNDVEYVRRRNQTLENDSVSQGSSVGNGPTLEPNDIIYTINFQNTLPIVIEEYNLIFFPVAKAASTEWTRFFIRLEGRDNWCGNTNVHPRDVNKLKFLSDYPIGKAQEMMTSSIWTRAIFVRDPKPRLLSAFLDKSVKHSQVFKKRYCQSYARDSETGALDLYELKSCVDNHKNFDFFLYNITKTMESNVHWRSSYSFVDEKWWPYINYITNMEDLSSDAENFLKTVHSNIDGVSAWDRIGKTGWSDHENDSCEGGSNSFLGVKEHNHETNSNDKMLRYYTSKLEKFVEREYADDYKNPYFHFKKIQLF